MVQQTKFDMKENYSNTINVYDLIKLLEKDLLDTNQSVDQLGRRLFELNISIIEPQQSENCIYKRIGKLYKNYICCIII